MNSAQQISLGLAAAATLAGLGAWTILRLKAWRRKTPEEIERQRRLTVNRRGRVVPGHVVEVLSTTSAVEGTLIVYRYEVAGVVYEAGQDVSSLPKLGGQASDLAGQMVSVKYDPKRPTDSILACEDWSGVCLDVGVHDAGLETPEGSELASPPTPST